MSKENRKISDMTDEEIELMQEVALEEQDLVDRMNECMGKITWKLNEIREELDGEYDFYTLMSMFTDICHYANGINSDICGKNKEWDAKLS